MKTLLILTLCLVALNSVCSVFGYNPVEHLGGNMKKNLDRVHSKASDLQHYDEDFDGGMDSFELENLEDEFLDHVEKLKAKGRPDAQARSVAYAKMQNKHGGKFDRGMAQLSRKKSGQMVGNDPYYDAKAMFDINILRNTANIAVALPVPLFGALHYNAKYISLLPQYLPAGVVLTSITVDASGNLNFLYTQTAGGATDIINVSCAQVPYITFLDASKFNSQTIGKTRIQISDITKVVQFNQIFETYTKTLYGKHGGNGISLASTNDPKNYPNGARDVNQAYDTDGETAVIVGIINVAAFTVSMNMYVQRYNRSNTARK